MQGGRGVELEVAIVVPGQRADAVAGLDAEAREGVGEPVDARGEVAVGVAVDTGLALGDDFLPPEEFLDAPEDVLDRQGIILH